MKDYTTKLRKLRELIEDIDEEFQNDTKATCDYATYLADRLLYSGVAPVRHGYWEHVPGMNSKCSECSGYFPVREFEQRPFNINYCPNCGAKMGEDSDDPERT